MGLLAVILAVTGWWHAIDPSNALVVDTTKGRAIVELEPRLAPHAVARVKQLARMHVYDGLLMWRVVDTPGFDFVQTGDPHNHDGDRSALPDLRAEFAAEIPAAQIRFVRAGRAPEGFLGTLPVGASATTGRPRVWGAYCAGVMGMGRERDVDSANAEIFFMRGTTRFFDHDYTVVGRIVSGLNVMRAAAVGVPPPHPDRMLRVRVLADLPSAQRPAIEVLDPRSPAFEQIVERAQAREGSNFSVCDVRVPVRVQPPHGTL
jgi:peptidylprolyl isomerase